MKRIISLVLLMSALLLVGLLSSCVNIGGSGGSGGGGGDKDGPQSTVGDCEHIFTSERTETIIEPTCTEGGKTRVEVWCDECSKRLRTYERDEAARGHNEHNTYTKRENEVASTCSVRGSYDLVVCCGDCDAEISREKQEITGDLPDHRYLSVEENRVAGTCTTEGSYDQVWKCACGDESDRITINTGKGYSHRIVGDACADCGRREGTAGLDYELKTTQEGEKYYVVLGMGSCTERDIVIDLYNGIGVMEIATEAFKDCTGIDSVTIGSGVFAMKGAFKNSSVVSVNLDNYSGSLSKEMFYGCVNLESIAIPASVSYINDYALYDCSALSEIRIGGTVQVGESAFSGCRDYKLFISDIKSFCDSYFYSYSNPMQYATELYVGGEKCTELVIPDTVEVIGEIFNGAPITSLVIPDSVTDIKNAFCGCESLRTVTLGSGATDFSGAFEQCRSIETVYAPSLEYWLSITNGREELARANTKYFDGKVLSGEIVVPTSVTKIPAFALSNCSGITSVVLHDDITEIGWGAFIDCTELEAINFPSKITKIRDHAFSGCSSLKRATIKGDVDYIGDGVFNHCTSLTEVDIDGKSAILGNGGTGVFEGCTMLSTVNVWDVTTLSRGMFKGCTSLTDIIIPGGVETVGSYLFEDCTNLKTVFIAGTVKNIGVDIFADCKKLEEISVPLENAKNDDHDGGGYIGYYFNSYYKNSNETSLPETLKKVTVTSEIVPSYAFEGCKYIEEISVISVFGHIESFAFYGCEALTEVEFWGGKIDKDAVTGCDSLTAFKVITSEPESFWSSADASAKTGDELTVDIKDPVAFLAALRNEYKDLYIGFTYLTSITP